VALRANASARVPLIARCMGCASMVCVFAHRASQDVVARASCHLHLSLWAREPLSPNQAAYAQEIAGGVAPVAQMACACASRVTPAMIVRHWRNVRTTAAAMVYVCTASAIACRDGQAPTAQRWSRARMHVLAMECARTAVAYAALATAPTIVRRSSKLLPRCYIRPGS